MKSMLIALGAAVAMCTLSLGAAIPPATINYQGVLLDNVGGGPENGDRDMIFHFYDAAVGGNEISRDKHLLANVKQVSVMMGLFNVQLGTGVVEDGAGVFPNDPYDSLDKVFRDFQAVYLGVEIRVGPAGGGGALEALSPRTRVVSAPYALNATVASSLSGLTAGDFINTSATAQTKAGNLAVADLTALGNDIFFGEPGALVSVSTSGLSLKAGDADTDNLLFTAGNSPDDGQISILGNGRMVLGAGNGIFQFFNEDTLTQTASLDSLGNLQIDGALQAGPGTSSVGGDLVVYGDDIFFGVLGAEVSAIPTGLILYAGDAPTDDLFLIGGNSIQDGAVSILGGAAMQLSAGNGLFQFFDGATAAQTASLDVSGNLQIDGGLTLEGTNSTIQLESFGVVLTTRTLNSIDTILDNDNNTTNEFERWCTNANCTGANQLMQLQADGDLLIGQTLFQNQFDLAEAYLKSEPLEPGDLVRLDPGVKGAVLLSAGPGDSTVLGVVSEKPGVVLGGAPFGADRLERMWGSELKELFMHQRDQLIDAELSKDPEARTHMETLSKAATMDRAAPGAADGLDERSGSNSQRADQQTELADLTATLESQALETFYWQQVVPVALAGRVPVKVDAQYGAIVAGDALSPSPIPGVAMKDDGRGPVIGIALESFPGGRGKVEAFIVRGQGPSQQAATQTRQIAEQVERRTPDPVTGIQSMTGNLQIVLDKDADDEAHLSVFRDGQDEESAAEVFRVDESGNVFAKGSFRPNAMDVAELFELSEPAEPGDVLAADPGSAGKFRPAREQSDARVIGVVASQPGMLLGGGVDRVLAVDTVLAAQLDEARRTKDRQAEARIWRQLESRFAASHTAVAMTGTVMVKADASYGAIRTGDLLSSSLTPGHAMRADDHLPGTIIGKALESLDSGTGVIKVLVMLR